MSDFQLLSENTHLSEEEAESLLDNRSLSGNPTEHENTCVIVTDNEVIVQTSSVFDSSMKSSIELALSTGADVSTVRDGDRDAKRLMDSESDN